MNIAHLTTAKASNRAALLRLGNWDEVVIDGAVWLRMPGEFKVSPWGLQGNYDKDCYWVSEAELTEEEVKG